MKSYPNPVEGTLRKASLKIPESIYACSGIVVFGRRIKSFAFTTDVSIVRNVNADAVIAVYPFTPQPVITQSLLLAADIPVFVGVGGGMTMGNRVVHMAAAAEMQGAMGVVVNAPTTNETIEKMARVIDIPVVVTVARADTDFRARIDAGTSIFNVSAAGRTADVVSAIRAQFPKVPIIATGGPTDETITATIEAGANAITWTPPSCADIFKEIMVAYREGKGYQEVHKL